MDISDIFYKQKKSSQDTEYNAGKATDPAHNARSVPSQSSSFMLSAPASDGTSALSGALDTVAGAGRIKAPSPRQMVQLHPLSVRPKRQGPCFLLTPTVTQRNSSVKTRDMRQRRTDSKRLAYRMPRPPFPKAAPLFFRRSLSGTIKDAIKAAMGDSESVQAGEYKITYKAVTTARIDTAALKKAVPDLAAQFTKATADQSKAQRAITANRHREGQCNHYTGLPQRKPACAATQGIGHDPQTATTTKLHISE